MDKKQARKSPFYRNSVLYIEDELKKLGIKTYNLYENSNFTINPEDWWKKGGEKRQWYDAVDTSGIYLENNEYKISKNRKVEISLLEIMKILNETKKARSYIGYLQLIIKEMLNKM